MCYDLLFILSWTSCDYFPKRFSQTHHLLSLFDLCFKFFLPRLPGIEAKQWMDLKHCSLVKEGRQSYSIALCGMTTMSSYLASKEPVGNRMAP